jgi:golgi-specific brefeldin A-resistance guanine nucleotide exchange factor 1
MLNESVVFPAEIKTEDATHVLAYSIIMLNTDQHNPQIRVSQDPHLVNLFFMCLLQQKRMTIDDYKRNLRGVNDGSDFSPEFLVRIDQPFNICSSSFHSKIYTTPSKNGKS